MKIHRHMVLSIGQALQEIFLTQRPADKVIETFMKKNRKWGSRDRRFFAESVYDMVRWWRKLWWVYDHEVILDAYHLIRLWGVYQLSFQQEIPDWDEFHAEFISATQKRLLEVDSQKTGVRESIPDWLNEWGQEELKDQWPSIISAMNEKAPVDLRVNLLKISPDHLQMLLSEEDVQCRKVEEQSDALTLVERKNIFITNAFKEGFFEVQDRASQLIAPFLNPQPGERVIDACAGAGGKTLHMATLMKNKGKLIALDIYEKKLTELRARASRNGIDIIETRWLDSNKTYKRLYNSADRVLLDVPCTGMGVLRRNPDTKWKLNKEEIERLHRLQSEILEIYSPMTKIGGELVYATCSVMPSENQHQVQSFLSRHGQQWQMLSEMQTLPFQGKGDGFYAAKLKRTG